jgi:tetratricopeptide (TPR) repeat protein
LITVIYFILRVFKKHKGVFFSGGWFLLALLPVLNLFSINALVAEHWLYLPSIGFFIIVALGIKKLSQVSVFFKYISLVLFCFLITGYFYLTHERNKDWRNEIVFYKNILKYTPGNQGMRVHYNLGCAYLDAGQIDEAIKEYEKSIYMKPRNNLLAYFNLARAYIMKEDFDKAKKLLVISINTVPKNMNDAKIIEKARSILENLNKVKLK